MKLSIFYLFYLLLIGCYDNSKINHISNKLSLVNNKDTITYSYYESGRVRTQTIYKLINKQLSIKVVSFFESGIKKHEVLAFEDRKIGVERFFFKNGKLSIVRKYQLNSKGKYVARNNRSYFSDDFFINGIKGVSKDFNNCIIETNILQEEFYENGLKKQDIIYDKSKNYLKIVRHNIYGKIESVNPIAFDFLTKEEAYNLIINEIECYAIISIITNLLISDSNKIPCWFYNGNSKYYSKTGDLIKEEFWEKGVLKETKEYCPSNLPCNVH